MNAILLILTIVAFILCGLYAKLVKEVEKTTKWYSDKIEGYAAAKRLQDKNMAIILENQAELRAKYKNQEEYIDKVNYDLTSNNYGNAEVRLNKLKRLAQDYSKALTKVNKQNI